MLDIILMSDKQIAVWAVAARLVQREQLYGIDVDHQWQFPLVHLVATLWAPGKAHVLIGIETEAVLRELFAQLRHSLLFPICHCFVATP